jgi:hypothetical protein
MALKAEAYWEHWTVKLAMKYLQIIAKGSPYVDILTLM